MTSLTRSYRHLLFVVLFGLLTGCQIRNANTHTLFQLLSPGQTGIDFDNKLEYDEAFNIFTYRNFYTGGGVAVGDINNDGLPDIFFTGNQVDNKLYLNKGNFHFEDITEKAGIRKAGKWSTGVCMADVNGDGLVDIYVCSSGIAKGDTRPNQLYINNGNGTFTDRAAEYGIRDGGYSTHAAFFDYDHDGDLDLFLLRNASKPISTFNLQHNERNIRDSLGGDKLYRNDGGHFNDVSKEAGIYGSVIGFGLGVTVGDVNKDGWPDIYVSNDFFERDYLYINNRNGTFREVLEDQMHSISNASMGADMADINNDSWPDIFVTEMLPDDESRIKINTTFENWEKYQLDLRYGYWHQFTRNTLQLNNCNNTFSEIGRLAGVQATDWSWGALITDLDNDGNKDIFVANGIYKDLTNEDYIQYISNQEVMTSILSGKDRDFRKLIDLIPSHPMPNYAFHNNGDLHFTNMAREWGLDQPGFSNGSAYVDLDNDGNLDLVVNNVNMPAFVYRNNRVPGNHWLKLVLHGKAGNRFAIGA
ncbi:MAG: VCBS repeat-containing protein, partial [Bacteroidetes bacterium]|nr:VCBS repeat-containing protein [Bacteroidota bacterium]